MFVSSRRGLKDVAILMDRVFQPPKNSVLKMTRGNIEVYVMDPNREIPKRVMNIPRAIELIKDKLVEKGRLDVRRLYYELHPEGWADVYNVSVDDWKTYWKAGVYVMNPYFELVEALVENGDLVEIIDPRSEGGIVTVPRYSYELG
jgi:hypothetical protein